VGEVAVGQDGDQAGALLGKRADPGTGEGEWVVLFSPSRGVVSELVVQGYNEKPRKPIKSQLGHQMMLVSDMVLLWDKGFKEHLQAYADDEELLRKDFAGAFKRLTELGCPWSKDRPAAAQTCGQQAAGASAGGCPFLAGSTAA